ncbi:MAG: NHL repeat-containing protein [Chloroflexota bacterium]|nr:NHL repeat-containing protein [Chloroflexota bacterium]
MARIKVHWLVIFGVASLFLGMLPSSHVGAQSTTAGSRTFPETGKTISGKFLDYWNSHGGLAQQGYPISGQIQERSDTDGKLYTVQYFERAVFELHPENSAPNDVLLSLLGSFLYKQKYSNDAAEQQPNTAAGSLLFSQTGKRLGGHFLAYWQQNGGLAQQGYPISDVFTEKSTLDGKSYLVQYFERAVFEFHPENAAPSDVLLSQLGTFRYQARYAASGATLPIATPTSTAAGAGAAGHQIEVLASGFGSPDDLVVAPSGDIIFGDFGNNGVDILSLGAGSPRLLAGDLNEPEGLVVTSDGAIIVAEQKTNRILEINYQSGRVKVLRQLVNNTGKDGVDGLGIDPATGDILVADSPNGRLLRMSRDGTSLTTIATGFVRPTGAAVEPGGGIIVVDEFGNAVYRLHADGSRTRLTGIYQPDDVVIGRDGTIYVNSLGGDIVSINPTSNQVRVLTSGLKLPHGLGIDSSGRLVIAEAGRNRIFRLTP